MLVYGVEIWECGRHGGGGGAKRSGHADGASTVASSEEISGGWQATVTQK